jgi:hypothetical protein
LHKQFNFQLGVFQPCDAACGSLGCSAAGVDGCRTTTTTTTTTKPHKTTTKFVPVTDGAVDAVDGVDNSGSNTNNSATDSGSTQAPIVHAMLIAVIAIVLIVFGIAVFNKYFAAPKVPFEFRMCFPCSD